MAEPIVTRIVNPELNERTKWDWSCLRGCFGDSRITPSDVDAIVERRGAFLVIETKLPGVEVPRGQLLLLEALALNPKTLVVIVWGRCPAVTEIQILGTKYARPPTPATTDGLRNIVSWWFRRAEGVLK